MVTNHNDIVTQVYAQQPAEKTVEGALAFLLRVLAALPPAERAGLLLKPAGENITPYQGQMVSASRVCYPDGQLYKILIDVPSTNGPQWADDGTVDPGRYVAFQVSEKKEPPPPPPPDDVTARLDRIEIALKDIETMILTLAGRKFPRYTAPIPETRFMGMVVIKAGTAILTPEA